MMPPKCGLPNMVSKLSPTCGLPSVSQVSPSSLHIWSPNCFPEKFSTIPSCLRELVFQLSPCHPVVSSCLYAVVSHLSRLSSRQLDNNQRNLGGKWQAISVKPTLGDIWETIEKTISRQLEDGDHWETISVRQLGDY